jgi:hypothetical protein
VQLQLGEFCTSPERLAWAKANGCRWDQVVCAHAAKGGHLEALRWARAHGCPWDSDTCTAAAWGGHLDVLKWARQLHCPWNENTCLAADQAGNTEVLTWARQQGCPMMSPDDERRSREDRVHIVPMCIAIYLSIVLHGGASPLLPALLALLYLNVSS